MWKNMSTKKSIKYWLKEIEDPNKWKDPSSYTGRINI